MRKPRTMYEFIYLLDGTYYIIGRNECKKCEDAALVEKYRQYVDLINDEKKECFAPKMYRDKVAEIFKEIKEACAVQTEAKEMPEEKCVLRNKLEEEYGAELDKQIEQWLKADTHLRDKEIEELGTK